MNPKSLTLFLDMDGVLADFVDGVCKTHNRPTPYTDPDSWGKFDMEKLWGLTLDQFWDPIDATLDFWRLLPKTPEADELVDMLLGLFSSMRIAILSAPSMHPSCVPGKRQWMQRHYPRLAKRMIFAASEAKAMLAHGRALLIDDRDQNCQQFKEAGGMAILMPRPWNAAFKHAHLALSMVRDQLMEILEEPK